MTCSPEGGKWGNGVRSKFRHHRDVRVPRHRLPHHLGRIRHLRQQARGDEGGDLDLRNPAATSASIQRSLAAVGIVALTDCMPSRGPTSLMRTWGGRLEVIALH